MSNVPEIIAAVATADDPPKVELARERRSKVSRSWAVRWRRRFAFVEGRRLVVAGAVRLEHTADHEVSQLRKVRMSRIWMSVIPKMRSPDMSREAYEKYNPLRSPAWRYDRVLELARTKPCRRPSDAHDDCFIHTYYRFLLKQRNAATEVARLAVSADNEPLWQASDLYANGSQESRAILEARILARESDAETAERTSFLPDAVAWYERLHFSVRDRLNARIWILKTIRCRRGRESMECGDPLSRIERFQFYKLMGYFGGPVVLDVAIGALSDRLVEKQNEITNWLDDTMRSRIKQLAILSVRRLDGREAMGVLRAHVGLMNRNLDRDDTSLMIEKNLEVFFEQLPWDVAHR